MYIFGDLWYNVGREYIIMLGGNGMSKYSNILEAHDRRREEERLAKEQAKKEAEEQRQQEEKALWDSLTPLKKELAQKFANKFLELLTSRGDTELSDLYIDGIIDNTVRSKGEQFQWLYTKSSSGYPPPNGFHHGLTHMAVREAVDIINATVNDPDLLVDYTSEKSILDKDWRDRDYRIFIKSREPIKT